MSAVKMTAIALIILVAGTFTHKSDDYLYGEQEGQDTIKINGVSKWGDYPNVDPPKKAFLESDLSPGRSNERTEADAWQELAAARDSDKDSCHYGPDRPPCVLMAFPQPTPGQTTPPPEPDWPALITITEVARISVAPSPINMWPASGDVIIQVDTPYWTTQTPQLFTAQILGQAINVRFTPISFDWDFGDGTTLSTTEPGTPLPNNSQAHQYRHKIPKTRITLTTYWSADFQHPTTHNWHHITGTLRTTTHSRWFATKMHYPYLTNEAEKHQNR